ncbi:MAG TPA: ABC transporter permease [Caldisericia bacterium]|nr:ABC transporter permease [Caldisericia bacterium]HRT37293.1 ABC transporter permease [Caldisericia bacterium]HRU73845.1 ABC transporter permease [Caldisericia bacterium]
MIVIEKRKKYSIKQNLIIIIISIFLSLFISSLIFSLRGINPFFALYKIIFSSFGSLYGIKETITKAIPLMLCGIGLSIAFKGKFWNIGAEGQLLIGAVLATWVGLFIGKNLPSIILIPLMFLAGFVGGGLVALIPALLKVRFNTNEVISTLMLNYIIEQYVQYLVYGPWKGKTQYGFPYTDNLPPNALLPIIKGSRIHYPTLIIAIILSILIFFLLFRTKLGYEIRVIGENPLSAKYAGIDYVKVILIMMFLSGGIAALAGVGEIAGIHKHLTYPSQISSGYGFTAIIVAWLAQLNPLLVIVTSLFFGGILVGGDVIQTSFGFPFATINIFNGLMLVFISIGYFLIEYKVSFKGAEK